MNPFVAAAMFKMNNDERQRRGGPTPVDELGDMVWWALKWYLIACCVIATIWGVGALLYFHPHSTILVTAAVVWVVSKIRKRARKQQS
jgi:Flp pilus assembly protein TadB